MSFHSNSREGHPYLIHMAEALDGVIRSLGIKAEWLARVVGVSPSALSQYRSGERPLPAHMVPIIDAQLGRRSLLRALAAMEGCEVVPSLEAPVMAEGGLTAAIAKHSGALLAQLIQARADGVIKQDERESVYPLIRQLIHELEAEAETFDPRAGAALPLNNKATGRTVA